VKDPIRGVGMGRAAESGQKQGRGQLGIRRVKGGVGGSGWGRRGSA